MEAANVIRAAQILGTYTAGHYDIWALAGQAKATCRQHVMTVMLRGEESPKNVPQKDCGVTMIRTKFYNFVKPAGDCLAARERYFVLWCKSVAQGLTDEMYLEYFNSSRPVAPWAERHQMDEAKATEMLMSYREIRDHFHLGREWEG